MKTVYIFCEVAARELDSKILLATRAAKMGMRAIITDIASFKYLLSRNMLPAGIFHAKSLNPRINADNFRNELLRKGFKITSIDEEHGLLDFDYASFAAKRFSQKSLGQAEFVFCWGPHDQNYLQNEYPEFKEKILKTGSPRVDIWRRPLSDKSVEDEIAKAGRYILIPTNFGAANNKTGLAELVNSFARGNPNDSVVERCKCLSVASEQLHVMRHFTSLSIELSKKIPNLNIVVRPHPVEKKELWRNLLSGANNVIVSDLGDIASWVKGATAILHNGCTTAMEAAVVGKPVITYRPVLNAEFEREYPNTFGFQCKNSVEVVDAISLILSDGGGQATAIAARDLCKVKDKVYFEDGILASELIADVWKGIESPNRSEFPKKSISACLKLLGFRTYVKRMLGSRYSQAWKFTAEEAGTVEEKFAQICLRSEGSGQILFERLGDRFFLFEGI
nr:surface carbohydrate biosynthesis protein [uncultured Roseovarius sp.]